jgi:bromodomain-containing protein 7/9
VEDPFSVLSFFVPDPPTRPYLTPLYPPLSSSAMQTSGQSTPISRQSRSAFPTATAAPLTYTFSLSQPSSAPTSTLKRRYWTITRNPVSRTKGKEKDDDIEISDIPAWQTPREAHATDFGPFALLAGELAQEMRRRGVSVSPGTGVDEDQSTMLDMIRNSLDCETGAKTVANGATIESLPGTEELSSPLFHAKDYWSLKRAAEAEEYLRDVVYGGMDGLAYVRSLAEFVTTYWSEVCANIVNHRSSSYNRVAIYRILLRIIEPLPSLACLSLSGLNAKLFGI